MFTFGVGIEAAVIFASIGDRQMNTPAPPPPPKETGFVYPPPPPPPHCIPLLAPAPPA